ncbi:hypothetical protein Vadar_020044 [Vaccinium darrowii]|uniref:Uncharacterized protein n=1 Tax=Vaccinium darrowii TaxID=229202 RepID=A0ACB7YX01_9ERIC|nr:hypothetical protein Vadar_020044 [Vaccinium darrowii]
MVNRQVLQNGPQWGECSQWDAPNLDFYNPVSSRSQDHFASDFPASTSRCQNRSAMTDDFPHLDIINDLLDDANGIPKPTKANTSFHQSFSNPHHLNRQFSFPMDIWMSNDMDPTMSSSSFEGCRDDCFQHKGKGKDLKDFEPLVGLDYRGLATPIEDSKNKSMWILLSTPRMLLGKTYMLLNSLFPSFFTKSRTKMGRSEHGLLGKYITSFMKSVINRSDDLPPWLHFPAAAQKRHWYMLLKRTRRAETEWVGPNLSPTPLTKGNILIYPQGEQRKDRDGDYSFAAEREELQDFSRNSNAIINELGCIAAVTSSVLYQKGGRGHPQGHALSQLVRHEDEVQQLLEDLPSLLQKGKGKDLKDFEPLVGLDDRGLATPIEDSKNKNEERKWDVLNMDCLANIVGRVGIESLLLDVPFVCKSWSKATLSPLCWRRLVFPGMSQVINCSRRSATMVALPSCCTEEAFVYVAEECPDLRNLELRYHLGMELMRKIPNLISKWKNLEHLILQGSFMIPIIAEISIHCKNFYSLTCKRARIGKDEASAIVTLLPNIRAASNPKKHDHASWPFAHEMEEPKREDLNMDCLANIFGRVGMESLLLDVPFVCKSWQRWVFPNMPQDDPLCYDLFIRRLMKEYQVKGFFCITSFMKSVIDQPQQTICHHGCTSQLLHGRGTGVCCRRLDCDLILKIPNLISKWKNLEHLGLDKLGFRIPIIAQISIHCKNFHSLTVKRDVIGKDEASAIVTLLPNIRYLDLGYAFITKENLIKVLQGCKEQVHFVSCWFPLEVDDDILQLGSRISTFKYCERTPVCRWYRSFDYRPEKYQPLRVLALGL